MFLPNNTATNEHIIVIVEWTHFALSLSALMVLTYSILKQWSQLKLSAPIKTKRIAETSQNFFINLILICIVLIYNICMVIVFFCIQYSNETYLSLLQHTKGYFCHERVSLAIPIVHCNNYCFTKLFIIIIQLMFYFNKKLASVRKVASPPEHYPGVFRGLPSSFITIRINNIFQSQPVSRHFNLS